MLIQPTTAAASKAMPRFSADIRFVDTQTFELGKGKLRCQGETFKQSVYSMDKAFVDDLEGCPGGALVVKRDGKPIGAQFFHIFPPNDQTQVHQGPDGHRYNNHIEGHDYPTLKADLVNHVKSLRGRGKTVHAYIFGGLRNHPGSRQALKAIDQVLRRYNIPRTLVYGQSNQADVHTRCAYNVQKDTWLVNARVEKEMEGPVSTLRPREFRDVTTEAGVRRFYRTLEVADGDQLCFTQAKESKNPAA